MPEVSRFFGIVIRMFYDEHNPPHFHAEYSGNKALFDFQGNIYPQENGFPHWHRLWVNHFKEYVPREWVIPISDRYN